MLRFLHDTYLMVFRRYPVLGRMAVVAALAEVLFACVNSFALPFYVRDALGQPGARLGLLASTFLAVEMLLKMPFGHLSDRYGRRLFASAGLALLVVSPLVILAVPTGLLVAAPALILVLFIPLRALDGVGAAALWPPLFAAVPDNVPSEQRGVAMSVVNTAYLAGLALGPTLGGVAMHVAEWLGGPERVVGKAPFALAAAAALAAAMVARGMPEEGRREGKRGKAERPFTAETQRRAGVGGGGMIGAVTVISFCEMFAVGTLGPFMALYINEVTGIAPSNVGLLLLVLFIPAGVLGIPVGHLADRWPRHRVVQAAFWTAAVGMGLVPLCGSLAALLAVGVVVTMGFLFALPAWLALVADLAPEGKSGRVIGTMATAQGAGAFLGPLLGGHLWDIDIHYPWLAAAGMLAVAGVAAVCCLRGGGGAQAAGEEERRTA
jgi:DHA1 family multidrug resistance protein-like MFS transporter